MPAERHAVDAVADDLTRVYAQGARRLETIIRAGLARGLDPTRVSTPAQRRGDATIAYRARALEQARATLGQLLRYGTSQAPVLAHNGYAAGVLAIDRTVDASTITGTFGRIHQRQVEVFAGNLTRSLEAAAARSTANVEAVFARAALLDGALPPEGLQAVPRFIGRRVDDPWRRIALETLARGTVALDVRKQISASLAQRLITEGVTDALTGFVDGGGRRWSLDHYAEMVARTTTREASSRAAISRLDEHGIDLVGITSHPHATDQCTPYDGKTFSRSGRDPRFPRLDRIPPFHPYCRHVLGPGEGLLDDYERELEQTAGELAHPRIARPGPDSPLLPTATPPTPPFGPHAQPAVSRETADRLEAQRLTYLIDGDPGPEPGAADAWAAAMDREARAQTRALNKTLGPDLAKYINRAWGRKLGLRRQLLEGTITVEDVEELALEEYQREAGRALQRHAEPELGGELRQRAIPCFVCGRFKRRPADVCDYCGDDPVTVGGDARSFNRNYGYAS